uniref:Uncharacterized protein n=1 Tax=Setaria italica TaxID=4555 RepID=K3YLI3_SETIT
MGLEMEVAAVPAPAAAREHGVEIYLLSRYYFGAKDAAGAPRGVETAADRALRLKAKGLPAATYRRVWGPADYLLLGLAAWADFTPAALPPTGSAPASMASSWWSCPNTPLVLLLQVLNSSFVLPGGRLRTGEEDVQGLKRKLSSKLSIVDDGQADAEDEDDWQFVVPRNMKLLAVPLSQIHNNAQVYGPVIAGIPNLLSKFSLNVTSD